MQMLEDVKMRKIKINEKEKHGHQVSTGMIWFRHVRARWCVSARVPTEIQDGAQLAP